VLLEKTKPRVLFFPFFFLSLFTYFQEGDHERDIETENNNTFVFLHATIFSALLLALIAPAERPHGRQGGRQGGSEGDAAGTFFPRSRMKEKNPNNN